MPKDPRIFALRKQPAAVIAKSLGPGGQIVVAPSYGIPQPRMSELERGIVDRCSLEWLIQAIYRLGGTICITADAPEATRAWNLAHFSRRTLARRDA